MIERSDAPRQRQLAPQFAAVGHITRDVLAHGVMAGGAAYYAVRTAHGLGLRAAALTSFGPDFSHAPELSGVGLTVRPAAESTCFENHYGHSGREQRLNGLAAPLGHGALPAEIRDAETVYLCPVMGEVELGLLRRVHGRVRAVGAQGWLREVGQDRTVRCRRWRPRPPDLDVVDLIVLSDEDAAEDPGLIPYLVERVPLVAFTHGAAGCELFTAGERRQVPAYPTEQVGPTGAGDVFGATMVAALGADLPPVEAAYVAACAASIVVEAPGGSALHRVSETWQRLAAYGRLHGVKVPARPAAWSAGS